MKSSSIKYHDYVSFTFTPEGDEILSGVNAVYVDGHQRLHICVSYEKSKTKATKIRRQREKLNRAILGALTIDPKSLKESSGRPS